MAKIVFEISGTRADGCKLYRLSIDGVPVRDGLTIDEVIVAIHNREEESLAGGTRKVMRQDGLSMCAGCNRLPERDRLGYCLNCARTIR